MIIDVGQMLAQFAQVKHLGELQHILINRNGTFSVIYTGGIVQLDTEGHIVEPPKEQKEE